MNHPHPPKLYELLKLLKKDRYIDKQVHDVFLAETQAEFEKGKPDHPRKLKAAMKSIRESLKEGDIPDHLWKYVAYGEELRFIGPDPDILPLPGEVEGVHFKSYPVVTELGDIALELYEESQKAKPARTKPFPKCTPEEEEKIARAYDEGVKAGLWDGQADYLRKRQPKRWKKSRRTASSWLSTLLKRQLAD